MKKAIIIILFFLLIIGVYFMMNSEVASQLIDNTKQGKIVITSLDADTQRPLGNVEFEIIDSKTNEVISVVKTSTKGIGITGPLNYGSQFLVRQIGVLKTYALDESEFNIEITHPKHKITTENRKTSGSVTVVSIDNKSQLPIKGVRFELINSETKKVISVLVTDSSGKATADQLEYGNTYVIQQSHIMKPYEKDTREYQVEITQENHEIISTNTMAVYVKDYQQTDDGSIMLNNIDIQVDTLLQHPELPNGCEITSLTAVLNYYGYDISKTDMSDQYLPKEPFEQRENKLFGANPYKAYSGNPRDKSGFFVYAPPVVEATTQYFEAVGSEDVPVDISGSKKEEIIEYLNNGTPVVMWVTLDLSKPKVNYSWYLNDTSELFQAPTNLHSVVLRGYDGNNVIAMNPIDGQVTYNADIFFESYYELGNHAIIIDRK